MRATRSRRLEGRPGYALRGAFLVARDQRASFLSLAETIAKRERERLHVIVHGPMAAWDFIDDGAARAAATGERRGQAWAS